MVLWTIWSLAFIGAEAVGFSGGGGRVPPAPWWAWPPRSLPRLRPCCPVLALVLALGWRWPPCAARSPGLWFSPSPFRSRSGPPSGRCCAFYGGRSGDGRNPDPAFFGGWCLDHSLRLVWVRSVAFRLGLSHSRFSLGASSPRLLTGAWSVHRGCSGLGRWGRRYEWLPLKGRYHRGYRIHPAA